MRIINTAHDNPAILDVMGRLAFYSGMDNLTLFEIRDGLEELMDDTRRATYRMEMEFQAPLLEMSFNGILVDQSKRNELRTEFQGIVNDLVSYLNDMLHAIGYFKYYIRMGVHDFSIQSGVPINELPTSWDEWKARSVQWRREVKLRDPNALVVYHKVLKNNEAFNPNSPTQKLKLFYHFFGSPDNSIAKPYLYAPPFLKKYGIKEFKVRKTDGTYGPTANREAMEKVIKGFNDGEDYAACIATPFAKVCLEIADLVKSLGFLNCKLDDGYFRASFGAVTETGRLNSRANAMGFGSNAQNVTPKLRLIFTVPQGWRLAAPDYSQIESNNVAAICYRLFGAVNYLAATVCGDAHTLCASMVWTALPWPKDFNIAHTLKHGPFPKDMLKAAKKVANQNFYRHFSYRDAVKRLGHGSNYLGKPPQMAIQTHIPKPLVAHFQSAYFEAFPEIPRWHTHVAETVQTVGEITTFLGRTRRFFGRPNDDATIREAVAYEPQSVAADYTNAAMLRIFKATQTGELPAKLILQKHDELVVRYEEPVEEKVISLMTSLMEDHIEIVSPEGIARDWHVPVEFETGWNLGFKSESNPDGLSHPDPTRIRTVKKHWKNWKL